MTYVRKKFLKSKKHFSFHLFNMFQLENSLKTFQDLPWEGPEKDKILSTGNCVIDFIKSKMIRTLNSNIIFH